MLSIHFCVSCIKVAARTLERELDREGGAMLLKSIRAPPPLLFSSVGRMEKVKELGVIEKGNVFFHHLLFQKNVFYSGEKKHNQSSIFPKKKEKKNSL